MAESFKYGNGVWATKEGSSLAYNDENDNYKPLPFSVTRDSIATRVNKEGLIEVVGKDKLRIDYTDSTKGVALLEPARTNYVTYSEEMSNAFWSLAYSGTGIAATVTDNYTTSPDGTQNASRLQFDRGTGTTAVNFSLIESTSIAPSSGDFTISFYAKTLSGTSANLLCYLGGTTSGVGDVFELTNEWQRFTLSATASTNGQILFGTRAGSGFHYTGGDQTLDVAIWGVQKEQGSYATSYIPTSGSATQRQSDVANGAGNSEVFNDSEGVLFADIAFTKELVSGFVTVSDGSDDERITIYRVGSIYPNKIQGQIREGNTARVSFDFDTDFVNLYNKIAIKYKANDFAFWVNGFEIDSNTSNTLIPDNLKNLEFAEGDGGNPFNGKAKRIGYFDAVLTDAELEALTSYTSFTNMANELNLTIK